MKAWHFVADTLRDGRPIPADGETLVHDGTIAMCQSGLHASVRMIDALRYAPGPTICRVQCKKIAAEHNDKFVCRERTILWRMNVEDVLRDFARRCALDVIHLWNPPEIVLRYLKTGDPEIRAAARDAAEAAARDAARDAAEAAAWAAAWGDAGAAAGVAAEAAARAAAGAAQNRRLTQMVASARRRQAG